MAGPSPSCQPRASVAGNTFIPSLPKKVLGAALGAVVAGLALTGGQAKALTVTVNSQLYAVTTFTGTYADNVSKFTTTDMPWWNLGDSGALAGQFASVVGSSSGLAGNFGWGPFFAYGPRNSPVNSLYAYVPVNPGEVPFSSAFSATQAWTYATATLASSSTAAQSTASRSRPSPYPWRCCCLRLQPPA